jgi:hypothetical protein
LCYIFLGILDLFPLTCLPPEALVFIVAMREGLEPGRVC